MPQCRDILNRHRMQRPPLHLRGHSAFTLVELLTSIGIILLLTALLFPAAARVRESARRTTDLSNLRQLVVACAVYASGNDGALPPGRVSSTLPNADDYLLISYSNCWKPLLQLAPALAANNSCLSVREGYSDADEFGVVQPTYGPDAVPLGWIYWGGRDDLSVGGSLKYRSLHRLSQKLTPGSQTLWTCLCWDSNGGAWPSPSVGPHVGTSLMQYPPGAPLKPNPDGLGVALADGTASFVSWTDLVTIPEADGFKVYYQP